MAPLLCALHAAGHELGGVFRPENVALYDPKIVRRHCLQTANDERRVTAEIHAADYDAALIVTEKNVGYRMARKARIPTRIGFVNGWAKPLKTIALWPQLHERYLRSVVDTGDHEVSMIYTLGRRFLEPAPPPRAVPALRMLFGLAPPSAVSSALIGIQITEKWLAAGPPELLAERCRRLAVHARRLGFEVHLLGARREQPLLETVAVRSELPFEVFATVPPWVAAIGNARLLITPDTGAAHVAGMLGIPCIDIFAAADSPARRARWQPWAARSVLLGMNDVADVSSPALDQAVEFLTGNVASDCVE